MATDSRMHRYGSGRDRRASTPSDAESGVITRALYESRKFLLRRIELNVERVERDAELAIAVGQRPLDWSGVNLPETQPEPELP